MLQLNLCSKTKKYKSFGHPRENKTMLAVGKGPPAPFSESWHWDWLSEEGSQPANGGSFLRSCGWRRQSSEVLYVTYQHGLPFNQRVERKDKVKPSSPGSANQTDLTAKPWRADKRVRHIAPSGLKRWTGLYGVRGCFSQTWAKWLLNAFQICAQTQERRFNTTYLTDVPTHGCVPGR